MVHTKSKKEDESMKEKKRNPKDSDNNKYTNEKETWYEVVRFSTCH